MKLVYTGIRQPLSPYLIEEARAYAAQGKQIFYLAPNSLSFEKERQVLQYVPEQASFAIMVTRFAQLERYFVTEQASSGQQLDDIGLFMIFYRVLSQLTDQDLAVYGKIRLEPSFLEQLMALYKEMQTAHLSLADLAGLEEVGKQEDLQLIFSKVAEALAKDGYAQMSKVGTFTHLVDSGQLDEALADTVFIVDGFTRFSAEEEALIGALHGRAAEILIGTYASPKAYAASYIEGNLYQESVEWLRHLAQQFGVKPSYVGYDGAEDALGKLSRDLESIYDFTGLEESEREVAALPIQLWDVTNQKEEVEQVAAAIRHQLQAGVRYKDILVLLGDVEAYSLHIASVFERYEIPYYLGKAEAMSHHPLVHVIESLEALKRYNFRPEDLINLLKSGLFGHFPSMAIDQFEQYILFADIKGQKAFSQPFTVNSRDKYDLENLNAMREAMMEPLLAFLGLRSQSGTALLGQFTQFLQAISLPEKMTTLAGQTDAHLLEKQEQVWKAFCHVLEVCHSVFGQEKLSVADFLGLVKSGILASQYRVVPATVDVVTVKSYDLIQPHTVPYVYAIGLSQSHFPKQVKNKSLLTDQEREQVNAQVGEGARLEIARKEQVKKHHFVFLSLLNAATKGLVLSAPQILNEAADQLSPYLKQLISYGLPVEERGRNQTLSAQNIGNYKALLSQIIRAHQLELPVAGRQEEETFWRVAVRYLRKKLEKEGIDLPLITGRPVSRPLEEETLSVLYPPNQPLILSASSLTDFYKNEYLYFLRHVLRLQEVESIHPDARSHGNFLHRIFERVTKDQEADFDSRLKKAILETRQEPAFANLYQHDVESQFSESILLDIARATSLVLRDQELIQVVAEEASFGQDKQQSLILSDSRELIIKGKMDRVDRLQATQALGIVDYKSGSHSFQLSRFYNGLSPQLMTYIAAVSQLSGPSHTEKVFGAMYLHMLDPLVRLKDSKGADGVLAEAYKSLVYKGLFLEEDSHYLNQFYATNKASLFNQEELGLLLSHHEHLYRQAGQKIVSGQFDINPYTEDGRSVAGEQIKAITGFEANLHLNQARRLIKAGKKEEWLDYMKKGGQA